MVSLLGRGDSQVLRSLSTELNLHEQGLSSLFEKLFISREMPLYDLKGCFLTDIGANQDKF